MLSVARYCSLLFVVVCCLLFAVYCSVFVVLVVGLLCVDPC